MTPDNSNISPLFGDMPPVPSSPVPEKPISSPAPDSSATGLSGAVSGGIFSAIQSEPSSPSPAPIQTAVVSEPVVVSEKVSVPEPVSVVAPASSPTIPESPIPAAVRVSEVMATSAPQKIEVPVAPPESAVTSVSSVPKNDHSDGEKLRRYMEQDVIYQSMLRITNAEQIRFRLALRYLLVMFAIFLVVAWIVNNRVIMFGFSEFQWLTRIRDALFGIIAGLFSLTLWFGSEAWFEKKFLIVLFRLVGVGLFLMVLSALYFPLW